MLPLGPGNLVALAALRFLPPLGFCPFKSSAAAWISWFLFLVAPCHFMASAPVLVHCCLGALWLRLWQPMMTKVSHDPCHHRVSAASSLLSPLFLITAHPLLPYEILFICSFLPRHPSSLKGPLLHLIVSCTCSLTMCSMRWNSYASPEDWPSLGQITINLGICGQDCEATWYRTCQPRLTDPFRRGCRHERFAEGFPRVWCNQQASCRTCLVPLLFKARPESHIFPQATSTQKLTARLQR